MIFCNLTAKVETQARAFLFSCSFVADTVELREDLFSLLRSDPRPFINYLQGDVFLIFN